MKFIGSYSALLLFLAYTQGFSQNSGASYIYAWKKFYPSRALDQGMHQAVFDYEDLSSERVREWIDFNKTMLERLSDTFEPYVRDYPVDARLLRMQIRSETDRWGREAPHRHSLALYAGLIARAVAPVLEANFLTVPEKSKLVCRRLNAVQQLCVAAIQSLENGDRADLERGLEQLAAAQALYRDKLPEQLKKAGIPPCQDFTKACQSAAEKIQELREFVEANLLPEATSKTSILGREEYARQLRLYTDTPLTPDELGEMAREEIQEVRKLIGEVSRTYLEKEYPNRPVPESYEAIVRAAFADMEKDAPASGAEYLAFWQELSEKAIRFIEEKEIATLPEFQTLRIVPAPESAGPSARIGWVESAPPFAPNPLTTLYLPSIPDTFPEQERIDFWSSFNKPFNRMIVIHELFPGHYMQIKISRESPHPVRLLFPYGTYFEGWATFTERVVLDAGWEADNPLTFLAHLRKRLENANRAYTSVQVHCNGWDQEQVMAFSTETSLLAPQFAKSLWGRLMRSPMQMTSYFWGGRQFSELLALEKGRLGKDFVLKDFMDTVMRVGPVPIDEFSPIFQRSKPR